MDQDHQKKGEYKMENTLIDKNWKSLIKPGKLQIKSNEIQVNYYSSCWTT